MSLRFSTGSRAVKAADELSLAELLLANRLPPSLFQAYEVSEDSTLTPIPISAVLSSVPQDRQIILQCIRNTDIDRILTAAEVVPRDLRPIAAIFDIQYGKPNATNRVHLVADHTLREIVSAKIASFLGENVTSLPLVAGISGGGDSNTLVHGIARYLEGASLQSDGILCFTLVMDPFCPESGANRAHDLCVSSGFDHRVLFPTDVAELLRMGDSPVALWMEFSSKYGPERLTSSVRGW